MRVPTSADLLFACWRGLRQNLLGKEALVRLKCGKLIIRGMEMNAFQKGAIDLMAYCGICMKCFYADKSGALELICFCRHCDF